MEALPISAPREALPWYRAWWQAVARPNVAAYEDLIARPDVTTGKAVLWVFLSALAGWFLAAPLLLAFGLPSAFNTQASGLGREITSLGVGLMCVLPVLSVLNVLGLLILTGLNQIIARALGGTGSYTPLVYSVAAYSAPLAIILPAMSVVPFVSCLSSLVSLYAAYLNIVAIRAAHRLSWGRAFLSSTLMIGIILAVLTCVCLVAFGLLAGLYTAGTGSRG